MKFDQRFNIEVGLEEAKKRFVNRVYNAILTNLPNRVAGLSGVDARYQVENAVCTVLGIRFKAGVPLSSHVGDDFIMNLRAIEALYRQPTMKALGLDNIVKMIMAESELDLEVRWENGEFLPTGAPILDEKLINDVLGWLGSDIKYEGVLAPFKKGLEHFVRSIANVEVLSDVVTDLYEALEALAKIVTGSDSELSANQEQFLSKVKTSDQYKPILKAYIAYANALHRHAGEKGQRKPIEGVPGLVEN